MPALLINIKIDSQEKKVLFKTTIQDLKTIFDECHVKIRGAFSQECIDFARDQFGGAAIFYQELTENNWVDATEIMLTQVKSRSVFLYFEDHKLVAPASCLESLLQEFDEFNLDYLCYSFFQASQLDQRNILPLGSEKRNTFSEFLLNKRNIDLISKISPRYYTFSLTSIVSVEYFRTLLMLSNAKFNYYSAVITRLLGVLFPYPRYRKVFNSLNKILRMFGFYLGIYPINSPFNLEKMWFEVDCQLSNRWKFGIPNQELFANYDDDNGAYGSSLIKKGLYPFDLHSNKTIGLGASDSHLICLESEEIFDCSYHSRIDRIRSCPQVEIRLVVGKITVECCGLTIQIVPGQTKYFYSNLRPFIYAVDRSEICIRYFDEIF